ncbi:MAG: plasmid mobilization protein [Candidatus Methylomirabilota bacterium]
MLRKDAVVRLRVSKRVKAEIEAEAERRGLSASAYLLSLHEAAMRKE